MALDGNRPNQPDTSGIPESKLEDDGDLRILNEGAECRAHDLVSESASPATLHLPTPPQLELVYQQSERIRQTYRPPLAAVVPYSIDHDRVLMPLGGMGEWKLWRVCVKRGSETKCLAFLSRKSSNAKRFGLPWMTGSAFARPSIPGVIYIQSGSPSHIRQALEGIHVLDEDKAITRVPGGECDQRISTPAVSNAIAEGDWVRIRRGHYKGDAAYVKAVQDAKVRLLVVPRILYAAHSAWTRASPKLFNPDLARKIFGQDTVRQVNFDQSYIFRGNTFVAGLLEHVYDVKCLISENVYPSLEEFQLFSESSALPPDAREAWGAKVAAAALRERDRIQILSGEFQGMLGIITDKRVDSVRIQISEDDGNIVDKDFRLKLGLSQVRKLFKLGDYVRIREGVHAGRHGYVVKTVTEGTGLLELVEWDKEPFTPISEPIPRQHLSVYAHSLEFAQEGACFADYEDESERKTSVAARIARGNPLAGMRVMVVNSSRFSGYRGAIQYTHRALSIFGVRLDVTNIIIQLAQAFLVNEMSGEPIYCFRRRPENVPRICVPPSASNESRRPIAESTAEWECIAWGPLSCHLDLTSEERHAPFHVSSPHRADREEEAVCQPSAIPEDWLALDTLQGKHLKTRISGFTPQIHSGARIRDGDVVTTTGKPVQISGARGEIQVDVKAMVPGATVMSVPSSVLKPVHPDGINEEAIIISGKHSGKLVVVASTSGSLWEVLIIAGQGDTNATVVTTPRENLVKPTKRLVRSCLQ